MNKFKNMDKKQKITIISVIAFLLLFTIGISYAFFTAQVTGNEAAKGTTVTTAHMEIKYTDDNEINAKGILPGWTATKTFTVENTGTREAYYKINWNNLKNTFINKTDLTYTISSDNNGGAINQTIIPDTGFNTNIIDYVEIPVGKKQTYTVVFNYANRGNQNADQGQSMIGKFEVTEMTKLERYNVTVDVVDSKDTVINPTLGPNQVLKGNDITFDVLPEGKYQYYTTSCTNNQSGSWNDSKLNVTNVTEDTTCTVIFKQIHEVNIITTNGTSDSNKKDALHEENVSFQVSPKPTFEYDNVTCSNGQTATMSTDKTTLNVIDVTAGTTCTVLYKSKIDYTSDSVFLVYIDGTLAEKVPLKTSGYNYDSVNSNCDKGATIAWDNNLWTASISNVSQANTTCEIYFTK